MRQIKLTNEKDAMMVSDDDYDLLDIFSWSAWGGNKNATYARTYIAQIHLKIFKLINYKHSFNYRDTVTPGDIIFGKQKFPYVIDHKDRNTLNNQRENLRICTIQQNSANRSIAKGKKIKGVVDLGGKGKIYCAFMQGIIIGKFKTEVEAARCYDKTVIAFYGEFACTNFPKEDYEECSVRYQ